MNTDQPTLHIAATKPSGKIAKLLSALDVDVVPIEEDEGNVDRYVISKRVAVERRTGGSFVVGIMDKTLFTSAVYLREHFRVPVLIVEGAVNYEYTGFHPQAVRGALSAMMLVYGISVVSTPSPEETAELLAMIAQQEQVGVPEISMIPKRKAADLPDLQRRVVEMLPGSGMVMARTLLQHFGSFERIFAAEPDDLTEVRGLGKKKAKAIHQVLHAEYEAVDTEQQIEDAIQADPSLLLTQPAALLARQHTIYIERDDRHVVDMVFVDSDADELILVELKRGPLRPEHERQLRRYLDHAPESKLLRPFLDAGTKLRGVLASVEPSGFAPKTPDVTAVTVDKTKVIDVLKRLREQRLAADDS